MNLLTEPYLDQVPHLPKQGRHIIAQYDDASIVVYQAFVPEVAAYAVEHQRFGGAYYSFKRMSWIKPNFLWMMHRSAWATSTGQTHILAIWLKRVHFDAIFASAVHSDYQPDLYPDQAAWKQALKQSNVRMQWDPAYTPSDGRLERRALQLGLQSETLRQFAQGGWITHIEDITPFVQQQAAFRYKTQHAQLQVPVERVYQPSF